MTHVGRARWLWSFSSVLAFAVRSAPAPVLGQCDPPPAPVADLSVSNATVNSLTLTWTAPGDDGDTGTAKGYDIRFQASKPIDDDNFLSAQPADTPFMVPGPPGSAETFTMRGLLPATNYYVAVRSFDDCLNRGPVSTVLITTPRRPAVTSNTSSTKPGGSTSAASSASRPATPGCASGAWPSTSATSRRACAAWSARPWSTDRATFDLSGGQLCARPPSRYSASWDWPELTQLPPRRCDRW